MRAVCSRLWIQCDTTNWGHDRLSNTNSRLILKLQWKNILGLDSFCKKSVALRSRGASLQVCCETLRDDIASTKNEAAKNLQNWAPAIREQIEAWKTHLFWWICEFLFKISALIALANALYAGLKKGCMNRKRIEEKNICCLMKTGPRHSGGRDPVELYSKNSPIFPFFPMEHLFFLADEPRETVSACREAILKADWSRFIDLIDFIPLKTPWLGFDHDAIPLGTFTEYPNTAGFTVSELWNANFRDSHVEFKGITDTTEIGRRVTSLFQAWLYYGLLESVMDKKIQVSYLMRQDIHGNEHLYSRNLHFCLQTKVFEIRANPGGRSRASMDIQRDLFFANRWMLRFTAWSHPSFRPKLDKEYPGCMDQLEEVIPAIVRLAEAVEQMRLYALLDFPTMGTLTWHYPYKVIDRRRARLHGLGWCPSKSGCSKTLSIIPPLIGSLLPIYSKTLLAMKNARSKPVRGTILMSPHTDKHMFVEAVDAKSYYLICRKS